MIKNYRELHEPPLPFVVERLTDFVLPTQPLTFSLAVCALKAAPRCPQIVIFGGAAVGYLVYSFFVFSITIVSPLFWVMAGIMDKMVRQVEETEKNS